MMTLPRTSKPDCGTVDQPITPEQPGRIKFRGSYWKAELAYPDCRRVEIGELVQIVGVQGITLLVIPMGYQPPSQSQKPTVNRWGSGRLFSL